MKHAYSIIVLIALILCACTKEELAPTMEQISVTRNITPHYTSADVEMTFSMKNAKEYYILYSTERDMRNFESIKLTSKKGTWIGELTNLYDGITYYYQLKIVAFNSAILKDVYTFDTKPITQASVSTDKIVSYDYQNAIVDISLKEWGSDNCPKWGLCYSTQSNVEYSTSRRVDAPSTGASSYSITLGFLEEGTTYYVRAYAKNAKGVSYGDELSFTTISTTVPIVTTCSISSVSANAAICYCNVVSDGGLTVTERGICYSQAKNPTTANEVVVSSVASTGNYGCAFNGLQANTTYYVRAYAKNAKGVSYGDELSFTTISTDGFNLPTVQSGTISSVTATTAVCAGYVVSDGGLTIREQGICYSTSLDPTIFDSKVVSSVTGVGSYSCKLTSLLSNTTYFVRAYVVTDKGVAYGGNKRLVTSK